MYALSVLFWALPAGAQVNIDGLNVAMAGDANFGYGGDLDNQGGSGHGLGVGGYGTLVGSYYNPNFLSFTVQPYYNRAQANADGASIFDSGGYSGNISIFGGGHFPGNISFNQVWDSTGSFGIPGEAGLTTKDRSRGFGIGWSELVPGYPTLSASFSHGSGSASVLGSEGESEVTRDTFALHSSYRVAGWNLGASFSHVLASGSLEGFLENGNVETHSTSTGYGFSAGHRLPLNGGFGLGFSRTEYDETFGGATGGASNATGGASNGTTDNAFANLSFLVWRFPITATAIYTDNLYGSLEENLLANGGTEVQTSLSPESRVLTVNVSTVYHIMPHLFASGYFSHSEMYLGGQGYGETQFGGTLNFNFGERFRGLTATVGANDNADRYGNTGATAVINVNYYRNFGGWTLLATYNYDQFVQTMLPIYQTSNMNYNAQLHRQFADGFTWNIGGGGGRTAFEQVSGDGSMAEAVSSGLSWRTCRCQVAGNYSYSNGSSVLTPSGLVPVPAPVVTNNLALYNAESHSFSFSASPMRRMAFSASYTKATSHTMGEGAPSGLLANGLASNNESALISGLLTYQFRKMNFNASVFQFRQGISSSGTLPSVVTSYYFSISRWLKIF